MYKVNSNIFAPDISCDIVNGENLSEFINNPEKHREALKSRWQQITGGAPRTFLNKPFVALVTWEDEGNLFKKCPHVVATYRKTVVSATHACIDGETMEHREIKNTHT